MSVSAFIKHVNGDSPSFCGTLRAVPPFRVVRKGEPARAKWNSIESRPLVP